MAGGVGGVGAAEPGGRQGTSGNGWRVQTRFASQTVVAVLQKGYFLNDRLLRPAYVKVAVGGPENGEPVQ